MAPLRDVYKITACSKGHDHDDDGDDENDYIGNQFIAACGGSHKEEEDDDIEKEALYIQESILPSLLASSPLIGFDFKATMTYLVTGVPGLIVRKLRKKKKKKKNGGDDDDVVRTEGGSAAATTDTPAEEALQEDMKEEAIKSTDETSLIGRKYKKKKKWRRRKRSLIGAPYYHSSEGGGEQQGSAAFDAEGVPRPSDEASEPSESAGPDAATAASPGRIEVTFEDGQRVKTNISNDMSGDLVYFTWTSSEESRTILTVRNALDYLLEKRKVMFKTEMQFWKLAIYAGGAHYQEELKRVYDNAQEVADMSIENLERWVRAPLTDVDEDTGEEYTVSRLEKEVVMIPAVTNMISWEVDGEQKLTIADDNEDDLHVRYVFDDTPARLVNLGPVLTLSLPAGKYRTTLEFEMLALNNENGLEGIAQWIAETLGEEEEEDDEMFEQDQEQPRPASRRSDPLESSASQTAQGLLAGAKKSILVQSQTASGRRRVLNDLMKRIFAARKENKQLREELGKEEKQFSVPEVPSSVGRFRFPSHYRKFKKALNRVRNDTERLRAMSQ